MTESVHWLDRLQARLATKRGAELIRELRLWLDRLERDRSARRVLTELRAQHERTLESYREHDAGTVRQLCEIRNELVSLAPDTDDSDQRPPDPTDLGARSGYALSLANFDAIAQREDPARATLQPPQPGEDPARSHQLILILRERFERLQHFGEQRGPVLKRFETNLRPELDQLRERFGAIASEHEREHRSFSDAMRVSPNASLHRLEWLLQEITPPPRSGEDRDYAAEETLRRAFWRVGPTLEKALYGNGALSDDERELVDEIADVARADIERVHEWLADRVTHPSLPPPGQWGLAAVLVVLIIVAAIVVNRAVDTDTGRSIIVGLSALALLAALYLVLGERGLRSILAIVGGATALSVLVVAALSWTDKEGNDRDNVNSARPGPTDVPKVGTVEPVTGTRIVKRGASRAAYVVIDGVAHPVPDGRTYICSAEYYPVEFNVQAPVWNRRVKTEGHDTRCPVGPPPEITPATLTDRYLLLEHDEAPENDPREAIWQIVDGQRVPVPLHGPTFDCLTQRYLVWDYISEQKVRTFRRHPSLRTARCR
jgi:hypothetical protein